MKRYSTSAPNDVRRAFWTSQSATPGNKGNAFIYGHTYDSKPSGKGVFDYLKRLKVGQKVVLKLGEKVLTYKITRVQRNARLRMTEAQMAAMLSHIGPSRTTLTTCLWNAAKQRYTARVNVRARLIS